MTLCINSNLGRKRSQNNHSKVSSRAMIPSRIHRNSWRSSQGIWPNFHSDTPIIGWVSLVMSLGRMEGREKMFLEIWNGPAELRTTPASQERDGDPARPSSGLGWKGKEWLCPCTGKKHLVKTGKKHLGLAGSSLGSSWLCFGS